MIEKSVQNFKHDKKQLLAATAGVSQQLSGIYANSLYPYPFAVSKKQLHKMEKFITVLNKAIVAIVANYFQDSRMQHILPLSAGIRKLLAQTANQSYQLGPYRPDFLFTQTDQFKICEINARFTTNGFFCSQLLNQGLSKYDYLDTAQQQAIPNLNTVTDYFLNKLSHAQHIVILKNKEPGYDIHHFKHVLEQHGKTVSFSTGHNLTVRDQHLYLNDQVVDQCLLELHQDELLQLPQKVLHYLSVNPSPFADLRTIFLVHDKRLLAILSDEAIMSDYLSESSFARLQRHIIKTYTRVHIEQIDMAKKRMKHWLLKLARSGKGAGMLIGRKTDKNEWMNALSSPLTHYVLQPYLKQKTFPLLYPTNNRLDMVSMYLVGCLPAFGDVSFGPGVFRASTNAVVNVGSGGLVVPPYLKAD